MLSVVTYDEKVITGLVKDYVDDPDKYEDPMYPLPSQVLEALELAETEEDLPKVIQFMKAQNTFGRTSAELVSWSYDVPEAPEEEPEADSEELDATL